VLCGLLRRALCEQVELVRASPNGASQPTEVQGQKAGAATATAVAPVVPPNHAASAASSSSNAPVATPGPPAPQVRQLAQVLRVQEQRTCSVAVGVTFWVVQERWFRTFEGMLLRL
jgi:hypothetical protein